MPLERLAHTRALLEQGQWGEAEAALNLDDLFSLEGAAILWELGRAAQAAQILGALEPTFQVRINHAAALTRSGHGQDALEVLEGLEGGWPSLRRANALWHLGESGSAEAEVEIALTAGRQEGDAKLTVAAIWQKGELALEREDGKGAVFILAEGLKIAELIGQEADPYLLAVLSEAQTFWGNRNKALQTAQKALGRSSERHLSFVRSHLAVQSADPNHDLQPLLEHTQKLGWPFWEIQVLLRMGRKDPTCALAGLEKIRKLGLLGLLERAQRVITWGLNHSLELGEE